MRLIDVDALIEAVEDMYEYAELGEVLDVIKNAPTVAEVFKTGSATGLRLIERPHGKWEEDWQEDLDFMSRKGWKCPFCKWRTTYGATNFCMNCGADLREDSEK